MEQQAEKIQIYIKNLKEITCRDDNYMRYLGLDLPTFLEWMTLNRDSILNEFPNMNLLDFAKIADERYKVAKKKLKDDFIKEHRLDNYKLIKLSDLYKQKSSTTETTTRTKAEETGQEITKKQKPMHSIKNTADNKVMVPVEITKKGRLINVSEIDVRKEKITMKSQSALVKTLEEATVKNLKKKEKIISDYSKSKENSYSCKLCDRKFKHNTHRVRHQKWTCKELDADKLLQPCPIEGCNKPQTVRNIKDHIRRHGIIPKRCKKCKLFFKEKHFFCPKEYTFRCNNCNKCFGKKNTLANHIKFCVREI